MTRLYLYIALCFFALTLGGQKPALAQIENNEGGFFDRFTNEAIESLNPPASSEADMAALTSRLVAIEDALAQLNRQLEAMPIGRQLPDREQEAQHRELVAQLRDMDDRLVAFMAARQERGAQADEAGLADLRLRLGQIEEVMRSLNGQIEDISFRLTKLGERFEQIATDTEFRFQELELAARSGALTNAPRGTGEPKVLGTLKVEQPAVIVRQADENVPSIVGEADAPRGSRLGSNQRGGREAAPVVPDNVPDALTLYDEALAKLRRGAYDEAEQDLALFLSAYRKHKLAGNAQYWLGEIHYVQRDYKSAASAFLTGYRDFSRSPKAPDSLLKLGMSLIIMGEQQTGCDAFAELSSKFPNASQSVIQRAEIERSRANCPQS